MSDSVGVSIATARLWARYEEAQAASSRWNAEEKALKAELMSALGYEASDPKPAPLTAEFEGQAVFEVKVGSRRGLDQVYLKSHHPDIYAEAEKVSPTISIRRVK